MSFDSDRKVAVLCTGLDSKLRGYETHQRTLFDCLYSEGIDVTLYKRDGHTFKAKEVALHTPSHRSLLSKLFSKIYDTPLQCQMAFFAVAFVVHTALLRNKFDHIMIIEPGLLRVIHKLKRYLPGNPRLVYTHGINDGPEYFYKYCDDIIEVSKPAYNLTKEFHERNKYTPNIWLIPHFLKEDTFIKHEVNNLEIEKLRDGLGIRTEKVLLHVGVICRKPKNVGYILDEFSLLPDNWTLLLVGNVLDSDLLELGYKKFGNRVIQITFPREQMWIPYSIADALVFASTEEGFGIIIIEALAFNLPVLLPDIPLYRWIIKDNENLLYELKEGSLSKKIIEKNIGYSNQIEPNNSNRDIVLDHYSWTAVKPQYSELLNKSKEGSFTS